MHVLVTGGAGFIGSHLVDRLLEEGHRVRVLDVLDPQVHDGIPSYLSADAELMVGDVRDHAAVAKALADVDTVVHLAAAVGVGQSMYEIERYTSVNAIGAAVVLEAALAARDRLAKLVVASSMSIYGEGQYRCPDEGTSVAPDPRGIDQLARREWELVCPSCGSELVPEPTTESKPLQPTSVYAVGKRDHEEMFIACGRAYEIPATALRFFNVYGPRQALSNPYTGVAAIFASRLLNGRPPVIFEDGLQSRDFVHVRDIVQGIVAALDPARAPLSTVNLGTGAKTTVLDVAEALSAALAVDVELEPVGEYRGGDIRHCYASIARAGEMLGFEPSVAFRDGMAELADWLSTQTAVDRVEEATATLRARGLTR
jgi:dTDP-L-rhamnose 4-epimerase